MPQADATRPAQSGCQSHFPRDNAINCWYTLHIGAIRAPTLLANPHAYQFTGLGRPGRKGRRNAMYEIPSTGFLRLAQVLTVIPLGKTCWWEGVRSGRYPKPVKLSPRCTAWRAEDILELIKK